MTFTHWYKTCSCSNSMAGAFEFEDKSLIDMILQEKKTVSTNFTVPRLLDLFFQLATMNTQPKTDTQSKRKGKILGFERHIIDLPMHLYHRSLCLSITHQVTSLHKLKNVINNDNKGLHWLKFLLQAIAYDDATHKKAFNEVVTYKALAHKCKKRSDCWNSVL